jgi:hypothetical protein
MMVQEARWFGRVLAEFPDEAIYPMLNVGSNTEKFRAEDQPWIDRYIFAAARARKQTVLHLDLQAAPGVDLVGDLQDPVFLKQVAGMHFRSVFCSNLLEHVPNRERIARTLVDVVPSGGCLFVSCPYRFPYHPDPIDTMYRPDAAELAALFPGTAPVRQDIVSCGIMAGFLLRAVARRPGAFLASLGKRVTRRGEEDRQVIMRGGSLLPWLFRRLQATCVVLRKL